MPVNPEDCEHVIVVPVSFQIHDHRREAVDPQSGRRKQCTFQTMCRSMLQNQPRRPCRLAVMVGHIVKASLDARGCSQRA
jgi:hypothetical protein